ncbi:MAG: hypothetical protein GX567_00245 [Clostridia bacterium]|nr:hypothetical protein [Clostridia bacterium]
MDRLYQREAYKMQVEGERQKKSAYYASLMKQQTAATEYNTKRLEEFYAGQTKEVADFAMKHPNWEDDVMQTQQMYSIMDKFLNNDIVREDLQVQGELEKLKQAYSSGQITQSEYEDNAARYDKYKNEGGDPFVFANPKKREMPDILKEINDQLAGKQSDYTDKNTGKITRTQKTDDNDIHLAVVASLADPENRRAAEAEYSGISEEDKGAYKSLTDYMMHRVKVGEKFESMNAGYDELYAYQAKKSYDQSSYQRQYLTNVYEPLAKGEPVQPHDALLSFGSWAKEGNVISYGTGENANVGVFKAYNKDGKLNDLTLKGSTKALGSAGMKTIGGVPFVGTTIQILIDPNTESANQELTEEEKKLPAIEQSRRRKKKEQDIIHAQASQRMMTKDLEDHGFTMSYEYQDNVLSSLGGGVKKSSVYVGTVWEPANMNETSRKQYDMTFTGSGTKVAENSQLYNEDLNFFEAVSQGNIPVLNSMLKYQADPEDSNVEYAERKDPNSGKTFIFKRDKTTGKTLMSVSE